MVKAFVKSLRFTAKLTTRFTMESKVQPSVGYDHKTNIVTIFAPIWAKRAVGVNEDALRRAPRTYIDIAYRNKKGEKIYPHLLMVERDKAMSYPVQIVKGRTLRIIPISEMEEQWQNQSSPKQASISPAEVDPQNSKQSSKTNQQQLKLGLETNSSKPKTT
jgi:hypothetical protein